MYDLIKSNYHVTFYSYEDSENDEGVWRDVEAISAVFRKRKGLCPNSLHNVSHIFITTNKALVKAVKYYNRETGNK